MTPTESGAATAQTGHDPAQAKSGLSASPMIGVTSTTTPTEGAEIANEIDSTATTTNAVPEEKETLSDSAVSVTVPNTEAISSMTSTIEDANSGSNAPESPSMQTSVTPSADSPSNNSVHNSGLQAQPEFINGRSTRTGYVYDVRMRFHSNVHGEDDHPEDPRRIWRIYDALKTANCTERMIKITSREATVEELSLVHTEEHITNITKTMSMSKEDLLDMANSYNSIYLNNSSAFCARLSCGSLLELCKAVATGEVLNGVAIVRPPGHHAEPDEAGGFCLYNNVAIAARYLQKNFGLRKIFILDWDVHHGNGTQKAFIDDPDVVYCSIHRYENGTFYPGDPVAAAHTTVGEGSGRGKNINIPWPTSGMGDSEYIYTFHKVIMPIIYEFAPEFILVSAGFDAAKGDHIGENLVTPAAYGHMTHMLKSMAGGKIILALEGGYNLDSIAVSGLACTKALLNDPIDALEPIIPNATCVQTIHEVMEVQSRYWKSLTPMYIDPLENEAAHQSVVELSTVLSVYRTEFLYQKHNMINMPITNTSHGPDFLNNVHCTQDLYSTEPLYIFVHNLGEFCTRTVGISNVIRPEKSVLVDSVAQYVDRIVKTGNQLIDIVVPYHPATEEEKIPLKEKITALLADIWDNFVFMAGNTRRIILLASGFGCHGMVAFMNERQKDVARYVSCAVLIPGGEEPLPMVVKRLGPWYLENSFVVVADDHPIWERTNQKANSRVGNLVRSGRPVERLSDSLLHLFNTTFEEIDKKLSSLPPLDEPMDLEEEVNPQGETHPSPSKTERTNGSVPASEARGGRPIEGAGSATPLTVVHPPHLSQPQHPHQPQQSQQPQQPGQYHSPQVSSRHPISHQPHVQSSQQGQQGQQGQQTLTPRSGTAHSSAPHSPVSGPGGPAFQHPQNQQQQQQQQQMQQQMQQRAPPSNYSLVDRPSVANHKQQRAQPYPTQNGSSGGGMNRGPPANAAHSASSLSGPHGMTGRSNESYPHGYDARAPGSAEGTKQQSSQHQQQQHGSYQSSHPQHHPHGHPQQFQHQQQQHHSQHHPYAFPTAESNRSEGYLPQGSKQGALPGSQTRPGPGSSGGPVSSPTTASAAPFAYPLSNGSLGGSSGSSVSMHHPQPSASSSPHGGYPRQSVSSASHEQMYPPRSQQPPSSMSSQHPPHQQMSSQHQQQQQQQAMRQQHLLQQQQHRRP